jgi:uncharacterized protein
MSPLRTYPQGVTCWVDLESGDVQAACAFYAELFGWTVSEVTPSGYRVAQLNGKDAAGIGGQPCADETEPRPPAWNTYIAVSDLDRAADQVQAAGGRITQPASEPGHGARTASCVDTGGVPFRLWQATRRPGAQAVNTPGGWNFSDLHTADTAASVAFYTRIFGWRFDALGLATMIRQPGYGDHLAATSRPRHPCATIRTFDTARLRRRDRVACAGGGRGAAALARVVYSRRPRSHRRRG